MQWWDVHHHDVITDDMLPDLGVLRCCPELKDAVDALTYIDDIEPVLYGLLDDYIASFPRFGVIAPEVFIRARNSSQPFSVAELRERKCPDLIPSICHSMFVRHYGRDTRFFKQGCEGWSIFKMMLLFFANGRKCGGLVYSFDVKLYQTWLEAFVPVLGVVYDPSAGWGNRLVAATQWNCGQYLATDPSDDMYPEYLRYISEHEYLRQPDIRKQGSEVFVPEWEGKVDLCATCPPYFDIELYPGVEGFGTEANFTRFVWGTCVNCHRYLKDGGKVIFYVGDNAGYMISDVYVKVLKAIGYRDVLKTPIHSSFERDKMQHTFLVTAVK